MIYTDGSKTEHGYGAAVTTQQNTYRYKCHDYSTVYTTELFAMSKALKHRITNKTLICTDALSVVQAIRNPQSENKLVTQIQDTLRETRTQTTIMWIPSHVGIIGNEKVDEEAKNATKQDLYANYEILNEDITKHIKGSLQQKWQSEWEQEIRNGNKLGNIKKIINKWTDINNYSRKEQTVLTRLRIGHTNLTHVHLIEKSQPPNCLCGNSLTVKHIFECTNYKTALEKHKVNYHTLEQDKKIETDKILKFLKSIKLFDKI